MNSNIILCNPLLRPRTFTINIMAPSAYKPYSKISAFFPPAPTFTDKSLPSLDGHVSIITGAASGVGYELAKILYLAGGTVYVAARSQTRCQGAIDKLILETGCKREEKKKGKLGSLVIDLADLTTVRKGVETFLGKEDRLDVLMHNAAVMSPPAGSKDKQVRRNPRLDFCSKIVAAADHMQPNLGP